MSATKTQTRPAPLSEAQRQVLTAAAQRPEGAVILPARLKGKAAQSLAQALLDKGLVREIRAKGELPVWRKDEDTGRELHPGADQGRPGAAWQSRSAVIRCTRSWAERPAPASRFSPRRPHPPCPARAASCRR